MTTTAPRDDTYNGWTNRETWAAHLYITNDEGMYERGQELARAGRYGDELKEWFDELRDEAIDGMEHVRRDCAMMLLDIGSLWRVDWKAVRDALDDTQAAAS